MRVQQYYQQSESGLKNSLTSSLIQAPWLCICSKGTQTGGVEVSKRGVKHSRNGAHIQTRHIFQLKGKPSCF